MRKAKSKSYLHKTAKSCAMWESAMKDAERLISETSDERLIHRLKLSIKWFKYMLEIGEPFPGQRLAAS